MPKTHLPLTFVMHKAGHTPADFNANDILYQVPWRTDSTPSLALYMSDTCDVVDKFRDMASGRGQGDVFDLIGLLDPEMEGYADQLGRAQDLLDEYLESGWVAPQPVASRATLDIEAYREEQTQYALSNETGSLAEWLRDRDDYVANIDAAWLTKTFGVVWSGGQMHIPYFDGDGVIQTGKYRKPGEKIHAISGSRGTYNFFYGEHLDVDPSKTVVICEGEPDVWSGTCAAREDYVFLGLPTGAGYSEKLASRLAGRTVLLALDADPAGREALGRWMAGLAGIARSTSMVLLPDGKDLSDMADIPAALRHPVSQVIDLRAIVEVGGIYRQTSNNPNTQGAVLSDFLMSVDRVMEDDEGALHFEVTIKGRTHDLRSWDVRSKNSLRTWAAARGHTWLGSDTAVAMLENHLKVQSMWVPRIRSVHSAGLHDGHFVWPGGMIGESNLKWVPGPIEGFKAEHFVLDKAPADRSVLRHTLSTLLEMNASTVTHPILAWLAAAPLRSQVSQFPILYLGGQASAGKTATMEEFLPVWAGVDRYLGLGTSPTRYAMTSMIAGGNAFPVRLDEYRPSGRKFGDAAILESNDIMRAVYNMQSRETGGFPGDMQRKIVLPQSSPLIVSGEDELGEKSLQERCIMVRMLEENLNQDAFNELQRVPKGGWFAHLWLSHLLSNRAGEAAVLDPVSSGPLSLGNRPRYNLGVLNAGWDLILGLIDDHHLKLDVPSSPDLSAVIGSYASAGEGSTLSDAIEAVYNLERPLKGESVSIVDGMVMIRLAPFVEEAKALSFNLSGSSQAVAKQMQELFGATKETLRDPVTRKQGRFHVFPAEHIFRDVVD